MVRNILRCGVLDKLLATNAIRVIIVIATRVPDYFRKEFEHPNIVIEELPDKLYSKFRKFFIILFSGLVYTVSEKRNIKYGGVNKGPSKKSVYLLKNSVFSVISKITFLKHAARWVEQHIFVEKDYDHIFEKYKPDLLFSTTVYSKLDTILIKAAKRFRVPSISMPKSWDTIGRLFFVAPSDKIILNNATMIDWIIKEQLFKKEQLYISGLPQFDIYKNKQSYMSKDAFCERTGLDKNKPIVLFASEGCLVSWDEIYLDDFIHNQKLLEKYNLIIRPHFNNFNEKKFESYKQYKNVYVDDQNLRVTHMFVDGWDVTKSNMDWLAEELHVVDVVLCFMSTFSLDAMAYDKPVINMYYDLPTQKHSIPMEELYKFIHYQMVLKEGGIATAKSGAEVMKVIAEYVANPSLRSQERKNTIDKFCYKLDGKSSERIANSIIENL